MRREATRASSRAKKLIEPFDIKEIDMKFWQLYVSTKNLLSRQDGQDLIEYALVVALIAFAAIGGMGSLAGSINSAFVQIGTTLTSAMA